MRYISVKNWSKFQHYKDRNPPWIKLHKELLTSQTWVAADDKNRALVIAIMMLAAATDNKIPYDSAYIKRVAYLNSNPDFTFLVRVNFIEIGEEEGLLADASTLIADARPETEAEREEETEESRDREDKSCGKLPLTASAPPEILYVFQTVGNEKTWGLTKDKFFEYEESFPNLKLHDQMRLARQWCIDNPSKRKTPRGMPAFLGRWLASATNRGGGAGNGQGGGFKPAHQPYRDDEDGPKFPSRGIV